jgi:hypothetical protein
MEVLLLDKLQVVYKRLDEIKPYENNPRLNDDAVEPVANSIKEFGFKVPIVVDKDGVIVAGHTRYKAIGNGMAQPCADFVMSRIAEHEESKV